MIGSTFDLLVIIFSIFSFEALRNEAADILIDYLLENEDDLVKWGDLYNNFELKNLMERANMRQDNLKDWQSFLTDDDIEILENLE